MRATFLSWCFGLVSIGLLSGCSLFDRDTASNGPIRSRVAIGSTKKDSAVAKAKTGKDGDIKQAKATAEPEPLSTALANGIDLRPSGNPYKIEYVQPASSAPISSKVVSESVDTMQPLPPLSMPQPDTSRGENSVNVKNVSFKYGHGANFESVTGQVQVFNKTMRLRYASIEQEDSYGGVVILDGAETSKIRDGQHVRVQGVFVPPSDRNGSARYRVHSVEILD